jgi:hypothetical protein
MPNRVLTPITELDFDGIKQNLKNYLSTTSEFSDYDYEGAGINVLLDLLAYNTHYTAMYANMIAAESFIDSAIMRKSIVSLAKNLGYVPNSKNAATATVSLQFGTTSGVPSVLPEGTVFTGSKDGTEYTFSTIQSFEIDRTSEPYMCENIELHQGKYRSVSFIYDPDSNATKIEIPSDGIDKDILRIYVMRSPSDFTNADVNWVENTDYLELDSTSKVYFVNENYRGRYEVSFGDGILGATPEKGNYIVVMYFQTEGVAANGIGNRDTTTSSFSFGGIQGNDFDATVTTIAASSGGAERDSNLKIKYAAPKYYQSQDRTVTVYDYESIILREYPDAESVRVWGGEESDPPEYGKVYISILPKNSFVLSDAQKESLKKNILDKKKIVTVNVDIVDVDYTYVLVDCFVTYDSTRAFSSEAAIKDSVVSGIGTYSDLNLQVFGAAFRYSLLSRQIEVSSNSIVSSRVNTRLLKQIIPQYGVNNYSLDFGIALVHPFDGYTPIVSTSVFQYRDADNNTKDCFIEDNGYGKLSIYTMIGSTKTLVKANVGKIDYQTGKVNLIGFAPTGTGGQPYIKFIVIPDQRFDILPKRNQVLLIDPTIAESITVTLQDASSRKA